MKNLPIRTKLIISHLLVLLSAFIIGGLGIFGFVQMRDSEQSLVQGPLNSIYYAGELYEACMAEQVAFYEVIVNRYDDIEGYFQSIAEAEARYDRLYAEYLEEATIAGDQEVLAKIQRLGDIYYNEYAENKSLVGQGILGADAETVYANAKQIREKLDAMDAILAELKSSAFDIAQVTQDGDTRMSNILVILMLCTVVLSTAIGLTMINLITKLVAKPVRELAEVADRLSHGDIDVAVQTGGKDEPGLLAEAFVRMVEGIREQALCLGKIAEGDYDLEVTERSDRDIINQALRHMVDSTNNMLLDITAASGQIDAVSHQVSYISQNLAKGSLDQAANIEQLSHSITNMKSLVEQTAEIAGQAVQEMTEVERRMGESTAYMGQLGEAVTAINEGSNDINKIIKTIDNIAFQTNILALNASVEAARAGQHGRGFAVVADEVRKLALDSAQAAQETSQLLEVNSRQAQEGAEIMEKANASLTRVGELAAQNAGTIARITESTRVQAEEVGLISEGIQSISQVVQANSATAQEAAASSEEMSAQSGELKSIAGRFHLRGQQPALVSGSSEAAQRLEYEQALRLAP